MKLDRQIKAMSPGLARQELMRLRRLARTLAKKRNNVRCWKEVGEICALILRKKVAMGGFHMSKKKFMANCGRYYDLYECQSSG